MTGVPFHYIDLQAFSYATEDEERVTASLRTVLPEDFPIERVENTGYAGDPITVLSARVERARELRTVLGSLRSMDESEWETVVDQLAHRITDNCEFYLYLDKQRAFHGAVTLGNGLSVRGKVEAYPANKDRAVENVREAFERD
ncbi:RNA-binding protein [Halocatena halophila]|uniref:RNA-binding protein n=1 Tax=Halocatena halophila TaxID=2814576 RepID=UPI002ED3EE8D